MIDAGNKYIPYNSTMYGQTVLESLFPEHCSLEWTKLRKKFFKKTLVLYPKERDIFYQMLWKSTKKFGIGAAKR